MYKNIPGVYEKCAMCMKILQKNIYSKKNHFSKMVKGELKTVPYVQTNVKFI